MLEKVVAEAGLRLVRAQAAPAVTAFSRYTVESSVFDDTPVGIIRDRDRTLSFGVSIGLPLFNRNQGARAEAETAIVQAERRRAFAENRVRADVSAAYARFRAAEAAVSTFERDVIARSEANVESVRGAYLVGAYRISASSSRSASSPRRSPNAIARSPTCRPRWGLRPPLGNDRDRRRLRLDRRRQRAIQVLSARSRIRALSRQLASTSQ
jgi:hypothetical protein